MAKTTYQPDLRAALNQEVERLNAEMGDKRPKPMAKADLPTGDLAKLVDRTEFLEDLQERMREDPELLRFVDSVIGKQVQTSEKRQRRASLLFGILSLIAGWLLSLVGSPANLAQILPH